MGAELAPAGSARPREDDWAGEARASRSPSFAGRGTATDRTSGAPFGFFASGANLSKRCGRQASAAEQEIKTRIKHLRVVASELKLPPAKFEARKPAGRVNLGKLGSGRRVCGPPRGRGRPAGDQPGPVLLWDRGRAPATQHVIILVIIARREAESAGPAPGEGSPRLSVSRLGVRPFLPLPSVL